MNNTIFRGITVHFKNGNHRYVSANDIRSISIEGCEPRAESNSYNATVINIAFKDLTNESAPRPYADFVTAKNIESVVIDAVDPKTFAFANNNMYVAAWDDANAETNNNQKDIEITDVCRCGFGTTIERRHTLVSIDERFKTGLYNVIEPTKYDFSWYDPVLGPLT